MLCITNVWNWLLGLCLCAHTISTHLGSDLPCNTLLSLLQSGIISESNSENDAGNNCSLPSSRCSTKKPLTLCVCGGIACMHCLQHLREKELLVVIRFTACFINYCSFLCRAPVRAGWNAGRTCGSWGQFCRDSVGRHRKGGPEVCCKVGV